MTKATKMIFPHNHIIPFKNFIVTIEVLSIPALGSEVFNLSKKATDDRFDKVSTKMQSNILLILPYKYQSH